MTIYNEECLSVLRSLPDESVHAVVCDPPYAISARNPSLDLSPSSAEEEKLMRSAMLGMQSANWHDRATHSRGYADNDNATFGRWCSLWAEECHRLLKPGGHLIAFGGTRTWHRLAVAVEDSGFEIRDSLAWLYATGFPKSTDVSSSIAKSTKLPESVRVTAHEWKGWGTTLKPAHEPIVLARKAHGATVAESVTAHGTGALAIDRVRLHGPDPAPGGRGRWPSNVFLDHDQGVVLDLMAVEPASRFFWVAKPGRSERPQVGGISHPTVKPLALMRELVRLVTPPGGVVIDPFAGSGTTIEACILEGFDVVGVELDETYLPLIRHRIDRAGDPMGASSSSEVEGGPLSLFD